MGEPHLVEHLAVRRVHLGQSLRLRDLPNLMLELDRALVSGARTLELDVGHLAYISQGARRALENIAARMRLSGIQVFTIGAKTETEHAAK